MARGERLSLGAAPGRPHPQPQAPPPLFYCTCDIICDTPSESLRAAAAAMRGVVV